MSQRVRLLRWRVANVGVLGARPVEIGPLVPGVNVIAGPNESGKSTMLRALRAALFERWSFRGQFIKELQPHGTKLPPLVEVDFEVDGVVHRLKKQLLVSPSAQLTVGDDARVLANDDADAALRAALDAHEGNKHGSNTDDMGLWGLLWVAQDEFATKEPAESMGKRVRADLATMVERQVGQVIGGERGVALRDAIERAFLQHFTPKQKEPTGALAACIAEVDALRTELAAHERALAESERLGEEVQRLESTLADLDARDVELQRELADAEAAAQETAAIEREREQLARDRDDAAERAERARQTRERRGARVRERAACEQAASQQARACEELRAQEAQLRGSLEEARRHHDEAAQGCAAVRERADRVAAQLETLQLDDEIARRTRDLADAAQWDRAVREAQAELQALPDEKRIQSIEELHRECEQRRALAERGATRLTTRRPGHDPRVEAVVSRREVDLGMLGRIEIEPARSGFAQHRARWRAAEDELRIVLARLHAASVGELRARAEADARRAATREERDKVLAQLAPRGIEALRDECARAEREQRDTARERDAANELHARLATLDAEIQALATDSVEERAARDVATRLDALAPTRTAGVRVRLRAREATRVRLGLAGATHDLEGGQQAQHDVLEPLVLVIDDRIEIEIDPGALTAPAVTRLRLQAELTRRLDALGVDSLEALDDKCEARHRREGARDDLAQQLARLCPGGLGALEERVERSRRGAQTVRQRLEQAEALIAARDAEQAAGAPPVTPADVAAVEAIDRRLVEAELEARRAAPRVSRVEGTIATCWKPGDDVIDEAVARVDDAEVTLTPGDAPADVELPLLEQRLRHALEQAGAVTIDDARRRHRRFVELVAQSREHSAAVARVAPAGLAALEVELAALEARRGGSPEVAVASDASRASLVLERTALQRDVLDAEARLRIAAEAVARRSDELRALERQVEATTKLLVERDVAVRALAQSLAEERAVQADDALERALGEATAASEALRARWAEAHARLEECGAARRREAVEHWQRVLEAHRAERNRVRDELLRRQGELEEMRRQGRYDVMQDKRLALDDAAARRARLEEEAAAVKLLRAVADEAYGEAEASLLAPVRQAAAKLLPMLWRDASLDLDADTWRVKSVVRAGVPEAFDALSGGAREQLAVIVRIALAQVLAQERAAMPLILDDILGWTDDQRLRQMLRVLERAAQDMQVIVLTCHPRRFEGFVGAGRFEVSRAHATT